MLDPDLITVTREFRLGILGACEPQGMCFAVCAPLHGFLLCYNVETALVEGSVYGCQHFWLRLKDGRILDPTGSQFNMKRKALPEVYLGKLPHWFDRSKVTASG